MKSRIATYLIALCMFTAGTAFATTPLKLNNDASKAVSSILKQELKYPKFAKEDNFECCVLVRLIINDDGSFTVDCVNCTNTTMKTHVTNAIEKISSKDLAKYAGQQINFKLDYKLI